MPLKDMPAGIIVTSPFFSPVIRTGGRFSFAGIISPSASGFTFTEQVEDVLDEMIVRLTACHLDLGDVTHIAAYIVAAYGAAYKVHYDQFNRCYADRFAGIEIKPTRIVVGVSWLPKDALVEMTFEAVDQRVWQAVKEQYP